jgi:hypothetical protein
VKVIDLFLKRPVVAKEPCWLNPFRGPRLNIKRADNEHQKGRQAFCRVRRTKKRKPKTNPASMMLVFYAVARWEFNGV